MRIIEGLCETNSALVATARTTTATAREVGTLRSLRGVSRSDKAKRRSEVAQREYPRLNISQLRVRTFTREAALKVSYLSSSTQSSHFEPGGTALQECIEARRGSTSRRCEHMMRVRFASSAPFLEIKL